MAKSNAKGRVLDVEIREELQSAINDDGLAAVADDAGVSPLTLAKAAGGYPVGASTILDLKDYLEGDENDADDSDSDSDEDEDDSDSEDEYEDEDEG